MPKFSGHWIGQDGKINAVTVTAADEVEALARIRDAYQVSGDVQIGRILIHLTGPARQARAKVSGGRRS